MLMKETNEQLNHMQSDGFELLPTQYVEGWGKRSKLVMLESEAALDRAHQFVAILHLSRAHADDTISMPVENVAAVPEIHAIAMDFIGRNIALANSEHVHLFSPVQSHNQFSFNDSSSRGSDGQYRPLKWVRSRRLKINGKVIQMKLSGRGRRIGILCAGPNANEALVYDTENGGLLYCDSRNDRMESIDITFDGIIMAAVGADKIVHVCNTDSGAHLSAVGEYLSRDDETSCFGNITSISSTKSGKYALHTDDYGNVFLYDQSEINGPAGILLASFADNHMRHSACGLVDLNEAVGKIMYPTIEDDTMKEASNLWAIILSEDESIAAGLKRQEKRNKISLININNASKVNDTMYSLVDAEENVAFDATFMKISRAMPFNRHYRIMLLVSVTTVEADTHVIGKAQSQNTCASLRMYFLDFDSNGVLLNSKQDTNLVKIDGRKVLLDEQTFDTISTVGLSNEGEYMVVSGERKFANGGLRNHLAAHEWHLQHIRIDSSVTLIQRPNERMIAAIDVQVVYTDNKTELLAVGVGGTHGYLRIFEIKIERGSNGSLPEGNVISESVLDYRSADIIQLSFSPKVDAISASTRAHEVLVWNLGKDKSYTSSNTTLPHLSFRRRLPVGGVYLSDDCLFFASGRALFSYGHHEKGRCGWRDQPDFSLVVQKLRNLDDYDSMFALLTNFPALMCQTDKPANKTLLQLAAESDPKIGVVAGLLDHARVISLSRDVRMSFIYDTKGSNAIRECIRRHDEASLEAILRGCFNGSVSASLSSMQSIQQELYQIGNLFPRVLIDFLKDGNVGLVDVDFDEAVGHIHRPKSSFNRVVESSEARFHWLDVRGGQTETQSLGSLWADCFESEKKGHTKFSSYLNTAKERVRITRVPIPGLFNKHEKSSSILEVIIKAAQRVDDLTVFNSEIVSAILQFQWYNFGRQVMWYNLMCHLLYYILTTTLQYCVMERTAEEVSCTSARNVIKNFMLIVLLSVVTLFLSISQIAQEWEEASTETGYDKLKGKLRSLKTLKIITRHTLEMSIFITHIIFVSLLCANMSQCGESVWFNPLFIISVLVAISCVILVFTRRIFNQAKATGTIMHRAFVWRFATITFFSSLLIMLCIEVKRHNGKYLQMYRWLQNMAALHVVLQHFKIFFLAQGFPRVATLVGAVVAIITDVKEFVLLVLILTLGFAFALFYTLHGYKSDDGVHDENIFQHLGSTIFYVQKMGWYGEIFGDSIFLRTKTATILVELLLLFVQIIFMNLLIALMSERLGKIMKDVRLDTELIRAKLVVDAEKHFLSHKSRTSSFSIREVISLNFLISWWQEKIDPAVERNFENPFLKLMHSRNFGCFPAHLKWHSMSAILDKHNAGTLNPKWLFVLKPASVLRIEASSEMRELTTIENLQDLKTELSELKSLLIELYSKQPKATEDASIDSSAHQVSTRKRR